MNILAINEIIKKARKAKGLTQQELAEETGLSLRTIQRIENGNHEISGHSLKQISHSLDIPLDNLIMSNLHQLSIDTNQIDGVKALYLSSLLFIINPIIGIIIPAALAWNKSNKTAFYKKQLKFIIIVIAVSSIIFYTIITLWFAFRILHYNYNFSDTAIPICAGVLHYIGTSAIILYRFFQLKSKQADSMETNSLTADN